MSLDGHCDRGLDSVRTAELRSEPGRRHGERLVGHSDRHALGSADSGTSHCRRYVVHAAIRAAFRQHDALDEREVAGRPSGRPQCGAGFPVGHGSGDRRVDEARASRRHAGGGSVSGEGQSSNHRHRQSGGREPGPRRDTRLSGRSRQIGVILPGCSRAIRRSLDSISDFESEGNGYYVLAGCVYIVPTARCPAALLLAAEGIQRSSRLRAAPVRHQTSGRENTGC